MAVTHGPFVGCRDCGWHARKWFPSFLPALSSLQNVSPLGVPSTSVLEESSSCFQEVVLNKEGLRRVKALTGINAAGERVFSQKALNLVSAAVVLLRWSRHTSDPRCCS